MNSVNSLDLNIINDEITNISEVSEILSSLDFTEEMLEHLKTLNNRLNSMNIRNKDELTELLRSKIMEFETKKEENINNIASLNMLKSINEDFQKLNIISTKREDNDTDKYIDYLTFVNEQGEVEMLSCNSATTINDFIQANASKLSSMSASDVFHHFKEYVHREVEFKTPEEMNNDSETRKQAALNDPEIERQELEEVESYRNRYGIASEVNVAVDHNGERIYRIGDGIIKFRTSFDKREMLVLKYPTITQTTSVDDMLSELDETPEIIETKESVNEDSRRSADSYASLEKINDDEFNQARMDEIVARRDVYDIELTYEEEHELNVFTKHLLEHLRFIADQKLVMDDLAKLAINYLESPRGSKPSLVDTYTAIKNEEIDEKELNDLEKEFVSIYLNQRDQIKALGLDKTMEKKLELETPYKEEAGVTTIVLLLELIALAFFILMFLRLDI